MLRALVCIVCLTFIFIGCSVVRNIRLQKKMHLDDSEVVGQRLEVPREGNRSVEVLLYEPSYETEGPLPVVFNIHGGAFIAGFADMLGTQSQRIADNWSVRVVNVNYSLVPRVSIQYGTQEVSDAVLYFRDHAGEYGIDPGRIFIMGYSAGGYHGIMATMQLKKRGIDIAGQILCYPFIKDAVEQYNELEPAMKGLAPALFVLAGDDPISQESRSYERLLKENGIETEIIEYENAVHGFIEENNPEYDRLGKAASKSPEQEVLARDAEEKIGAWIQDPSCMYSRFLNPPTEARPQVWWHWMNGNISREGIRKDLLWMKEAGLGGVHIFDAGLDCPQVAPERIPYMTEAWKECFKGAVSLADSLGLPVTITSAPGWSCTGGPWVKPENGMKKVVWREVSLSGGKKISMDLPAGYDGIGTFQNCPVNIASYYQDVSYYEDIAVFAVRDASLPPCSVEVNGSTVDASVLGDGDFTTGVRLQKDPSQGVGWILFRFERPADISAVSVGEGVSRALFLSAPGMVTATLECSDDGISFRKVCDIPAGGVMQQTISFPKVSARYFRACFNLKHPYSAIMSIPERQEAFVTELRLFADSRVNHAEEKAGFSTYYDVDRFLSPEDTGADVVDLSSYVTSGGHLEWDAPEGNWTVYRFGCSPIGRVNHPASAEATGLEVDKLDADAVRAYMEEYLRMYDDASGKQLGKAVTHLLVDSYEAGACNWTPSLPAEFKSRRGYDMMPWMPALAGRIICSSTETEAFLRDFRRTIGELISDNHYGTIDRVCAGHGLGTYFEAHEAGRAFLADGLSVKSRSDIPMAAIWAKVPGSVPVIDTDLAAQLDIRESASAARLYGKRYVAAESLTANGLEGYAYGYSPADLKGSVDLELASGVNRIVIHESAHQPCDSLKPGLSLQQFGQWFTRHETWAGEARAFTDYMARSCYLLSLGRNVSDVLYYYGDEINTTGRLTDIPDVPATLNYDFVNSESLLSEDVDFSGYRALIIHPDAGSIPENVQDVIDRLQKKMVPAEEIPADFSCPGIEHFRFVHRSTSNAEIYWVWNRSDELRSVDASFRVAGLVPELWCPEDGSRTKPCYKEGENTTTVHLDMDAGDAVFVVFGSAFAGAPDDTLYNSDTRWHSERSEESVLRGPWTVSFLDGRGAPEKIEFQKLESYTAHPDPAIRYYSGTALYSKTFTLGSCGGPVWLDLGRVACLAHVYVNGKDFGTLWHAPFRINISSAVHEGENTLEVKVVNQWVNRIIGDLQPGVTRRYTYTSYPYYKASDELLSAGLLGPVKIYHLSKSLL